MSKEMHRLTAGGIMIRKCCNPACEVPFDHRQGRLVRFSSKPANDKPAEKYSSIQHFWLCGKCADLFVFESESGITLKIKPRHQELSRENLSFFVTAA
jgi:hypothetical protein